MSEKPEALADRLDDERMNLIERLADENERLREENRLWKSRCIALVWKGDTDNITAGRLQSAAKEIDAALRREYV